MDPHDTKKALMKRIPEIPSFSSAPLNISIPSFSSAPKPKIEERDKSPKRQRRSRSPRHRSRSPRRRSRSPRKRSLSPRRRSRSPRSSRRRSRSSHRHSKQKRSRKRTPSPELVHTGTLSTGITFVMDRKGDSDNLKYGVNHAYSVPEFKRTGGGRIVGLPEHKRIDYATSKHGQVTLVNKFNRKGQRYTDADYAWKELDKSLKRIHLHVKQVQHDPFASHNGKILLEDTRQSDTANDDNAYMNLGVDYRSLEGNKVKKEQDIEEVEEEEEGESFNDYIRQKTIEFNRQLDKTPEDIQLWLDFIRFQDEAATGLDPSKSKSNQSSVNQVKLSIFEKALDLNPENEELAHAYLQCGAQVWDTLKLLREWDSVLKQHPDSIRLWSDYINTRQTNFMSFTFTQCVQVFEDALNTLSIRANRHHGDVRDDIESLMVYVLLRACLFMKQSGYQEKAFAIIQAIVEFNLYKPYMIDTKFESKLNAFAEFWDSEVLRFGEEGALGWHTFYQAQHAGKDVEEPNFDIPEDKNDEEDEIMTMEDWVKSEINNESKHRLPLRMVQADDDNVDEDPYRIILSDDLRPFLFNITTPGARQSLIYSIFVFLGLPYTPPEVGTNTHFFTDTFTHNDLNLSWPIDKSTTKHLLWYVAGVPMNPEQTINETNPYFIPSSYPVRISELFAKSGSWFKSSGKEYIHCNIDEQFTRVVFQQLLNIEKSNHLTLCYLAFESSCGHKLGRKLAKNLLKDQRTNLLLWNAYAQMEKSYDRIEEARKVYMTALSMYHSFSESEQLHVPLLYLMFAKLELQDNRPDEALKILVSMSDTKPYDQHTLLPTTPLILRSREYFTQKMGQLSTLSPSFEERQAAISMIGCYGLFEYLSTGIDGVTSIYEHAFDYIQERQAERGYESEVLWVEYAGLLYYHASSQKYYKPGILREMMERALGLFPNNTIFLAFYIWNESKTKINNRVQKLLNDMLKKDSNVILWLSAIYSELHRYKPYHVNSVRDYFERSIEDTKTKSSIILWKYYIQFEMLQNNLDKAKSLFYRAIRECPWSKELYLIGIQTFSKQMDDKEMNELVSLMMEKEIRLRNPIEEDLLT